MSHHSRSIPGLVVAVAVAACTGCTRQPPTAADDAPAIQETLVERWNGVSVYRTSDPRQQVTVEYVMVAAPDRASGQVRFLRFDEAAMHLRDEDAAFAVAVRVFVPAARAGRSRLFAEFPGVERFQREWNAMEPLPAPLGEDPPASDPGLRPRTPCPKDGCGHLSKNTWGCLKCIFRE